MMTMLKHVDLCSGIGGFALGFEWAGLSQPILFCDTDEWCRKVLNKHWPDVPIANDVKDLANDPTQIPDCDILTAGYPCQPFSLAGKQKGTEDDRHIWPYIHQIVAHKRPTWCIFENVYGHVTLGLDQVLLDLECEGYASRAFVVPAASVDAPHRRDRVWIVGNAKHNGQFAATVGRSTLQASNDNEERPDTSSQSQGTSRPSDSSEVARGTDVPDTNAQRLQGDVGQGASGTQGTSTGHAAEQGGRVTQSRLGGVADGIPDWVDEPDDIPRLSTGQKDRTNRLKGLGNAIVPQIAMQIGLTIKSQIVEKQ
jgi:DNA (cytosine-5)-methyltransferase 1